MNQRIKNKIFSLVVVFCIVMQTLAPIGVIKVKAEEQETVIDVSKGAFEINGNQYKQGGDWIDIVGELVVTGINNSGFKYKITGENPTITYRDLNSAIAIDTVGVTGQLTVKIESYNYIRNALLAEFDSNNKALTKINIVGVNDGFIDNIQLNRYFNPAPTTGFPVEIRDLNITGQINISSWINANIQNINHTNTNITGTKLRLNSYMTETEDSMIVTNSIFDIIYLLCAGGVTMEGVSNYNAPQSSINNYGGTHNPIAVYKIKDGSNINLQSISLYNMDISNSKVHVQRNIELKGSSPTLKVVGSTVITGSDTSHQTDIYTKSNSTAILEDSSLDLRGINFTINRFYNTNSKAKHDPINTMSKPLFLNKIQVPNNSNVRVEVSIDGREPVKLWTNEEGFLHLYLTTGNHTVEITDLNGKEYFLEFVGSSVRESSLDSNIIGSVIPTTEDITFDLSPNYNTQIEYSFDKVSWKSKTTDSEGKIVISVPKEATNIFFRINGEIFASDGQSPVMKYAPIILGQSNNTLVQENSSTTLFVLAKPYESGNSLTYQWYKDGAILPGETKSTLNISSMQKANEGTYTCMITESNGMSSSSNPIAVSIGSVGAGVDEGILEDLQNQISMLEGQLTQANTDKETLQNTISGLNNQVTSLNETIVSLNSQITALQGLNEGLEEENEELLQQIAELIQQLSDANSQITILQSQISILTAEKEGLSNQILTLESTITNLNLQIASLNLLLQEKEEENSDLKDTITSLNQQIQNLTEQVNIYLQDINTLEVQNTLLTEQITGLTSQNADLLLQLSTLQGQLNAANIRITELEEEISEFAVKQAQLEGEKLALEQSNQALLEQVSSLTIQNSQLQTKVTELQEQLDNANSRIEDLQEEVATLELRIAELEGLLSAANTEKGSLSQQVQEHLQTIIQLNIQITNLEELVSLLSSETGDNEEVIKNLNLQITNLNSQVFNLQEEINLLRMEKANLEIQVSDLQLQITNLTNTIVTLTNRVTELEGINSSLLDSLVEANSKITNLEASVLGLNERITELEGNTTILTNELVNAQNRLLAVNSLLELIKDELGIENEEDILPAIRSLLEKLQQEKDKNIVLQNAIDKAIQDLNIATNSNQQLQQRLEELEELLSNNENEELLQKILELQQQLSNSKNKVIELEEERNALQEQLNSSLEQLDLLQKKLESMQENEKDFENKLIELEKELDDLKQDNDSLEKSIQILEGESNRLVTENDELQIELKRLENLLDMANKTIEELQEMIKSLTEENSELKKEKIILSKEIEELKKNSSGSSSAPSTNEKEEEKVTLPSEESVIVSPVEDNKVVNVINQSTDKVISDEITAKNGWEINDKLNEDGWKKAIDLSEVLVPNATEYTFFAREEEKPKEVYTIKVEVEEQSLIPTYNIPKTIYLGSSYKVHVENQEDGTITYTSMDKNIATVSSDGTITSVGVGTTTIIGTIKTDKKESIIQINVSVKEGGKTYNLKESVVQTTTDAPTVAMYKLLKNGASTKIDVKSNKAGATINYISSNPKIVTVDSKGTITGKKKGDATIITTVSYGNQLYTYITKVRVDDGTPDNKKWEYLK